MKRNTIIALAAILTFSLALSGCTLAANPVKAGADRTASYETRGNREDNVNLGAGNRGENATAGTNAAGYGTGSGRGTGNGRGDGAGNEAGPVSADNCAPIAGEPTADPNFTLSEADKALSSAGYGAEGALGDADLSFADMLTYAIQDEYLARAEYDWILQSFASPRAFANIMRAEETHIDSLLPLFTAYGITPPADEGASRAATVSSITEAYQAGVNAEVNNIAMYESFLEENLPDNVRIVFESLLRASENHLRAFQNQL